MRVTVLYYTLSLYKKQDTILGHQNIHEFQVGRKNRPQTLRVSELDDLITHIYIRGNDFRANYQKKAGAWCFQLWGRGDGGTLAAGGAGA